MRFQSLVKRILTEKKSSGNALMEYAVPASIILLSTGLFATLTSTSDLMAMYFLSASGRSTMSLNGKTLETKGLAENVTGDIGMGLAGFGGSPFATVTGGAGGAEPSATLYSGAVTRTGGRTGSSSPEYLYN